jgi:hypothetical protein
LCWPIVPSFVQGSIDADRLSALHVPVTQLNTDPGLCQGRCLQPRPEWRTDDGVHRNLMGTCVREMTSAGSPYTIFRRALERRSLVGVRSAVANLPAPPSLDDALVICLLMLDHEPDRYEAASVRWIGRLLLEQPGLRLCHAELAAAYLAAWPDPARHHSATEALGELGRAVGLPGWASASPLPTKADRHGYDRPRS